MSDRERLIELIEKWNKDEFAISYASYELADYFIENGVVFQKQGEWIFGRNHGDFVEATCTSCYGMLLVKWYDKIDKYRHCPNCGAKMRGVK